MAAPRELTAEPVAQLDVVCLPDVFVDHLVALPAWDQAMPALKAAHERGGGNVRGFPQRLVVGGNAANAAHALARLGVRVHLVGRTGPLGLALARDVLSPLGADLAGLRDDGGVALTVALEFGAERANVMLNDAATLAGYGPGDLSDADRALVRRADAVLVANWGNLRHHGTALAEAVFREARAGGTLTVLDTSDPSDRMRDVPALMDRVVRAGLVDVFQMNDVELRAYAGAGPVEEAGPRLAKETPGTVDVHTREHAYTWGRAGRADAPACAVRVERTTGAGDAWGAGNVVGHLLELAPRDRLRLAHAVAACWISGDEPGTLADVLRRLR